MSVHGRLRAIVIFEQLHNAQLHLKKRRNGNAPLATLCPIWPSRYWNSGPPGPQTKPLAFHQQTSLFFFK